MSLVRFYAPQLEVSSPVMTLDEQTSKHCVQVLRMREGDSLLLTDGRGLTITATIRTPHKRSCEVTLLNPVFEGRQGPEVYIGISPIKNTSRFEWFLEKATEIGVTGIIPLLCERTERATFRQERMTSILVSAMLQSQQAWLPELKEPLPLRSVLEKDEVGRSLGNDPGSDYPPARYIAHCINGVKRSIRDLNNPSNASIIIIGPEGDFTSAEVDNALSRGWLPVTLGETRLRTETAGIVAATLLRLG